MDKKHAILLYLLLLFLGIGTVTAATSATPDLWEMTKAVKIASESSRLSSALDLNSPKFSAGSISESSEMQKSSRQFLAKSKSLKAISLSDLEGARTVISRPTTGLLLSSDATVTKAGNDSVVIDKFIFTDVKIKAKVDAATGVVSIPVQKITTLTQGDVYMCRVNTQTSVYSTTADIEGVVSDGDIHINDAFGFFIIEGDYAGRYLTAGIQNYADVATLNSTITNKKVSYTDNSFTTANRNVTEESGSGYIYQVNEDQIRISYLSSSQGHVALLADIANDGTVSVDPQPLFYKTLYGNFCCYPMTETASGTTIKISAAITSPLTGKYDSTAKTLKFGEWLIASTTVSSFSDLFESTSITTTANITLPNKAVFALDGEGTAESPYLVKSATDLATIATFSTDSSFLGESKTDSESNTYQESFAGKYFKVVNDIDFSTYKKAYKPIGNSKYRFAGNFDGGNYTVSGFTMTNYAYDYAGLFGVIDETGVVKNIKFTSPYMTTLGYCIGVIAGKSYGLVDSIEVTGGKVYATSGYNAGGIVGYNFGTISNSKFTESGAIQALGYIGGITGRSYGPIKNCSANARLTMTGKQVFVGGIVGYMSMKNPNGNTIELSDCDYTGMVTGSGSETSLGGIAGMVANVTMQRCYATAYIYSGNSVSTSLGGLIGSLWQSNIIDCYATGVVNNPSSTECGGLIGHNAETSSCTGSTIKNSYAANIVITTNTGNTYGIIGSDAQNKTTITNSFYDKQLNPVENETMAKSTTELTSADGISSFDASTWQYEAGLYPRLKAHADKASAKLSATSVTFKDNENWKMVKNDFTYSTANDIVWKGLVNGKYSTEGGYAFSFNEGTAKLNYNQYTDTIYAFSGKMYKIFFANIAPIDFKGEGTAESPWEIATKADWKSFSDLSNNASIDFAGKYLKVVADIDCEGDTIVPICKDNGGKFCFQGTLDGDGHTINNIVISTVAFYEEGNSAGKPVGEVNPKSSDSYLYGGLFANIGDEGTVKNLTIGNGCKFEIFGFGGAIAGSSAGVIDNCRNFAPVTSYFSKAGGMVGDLKKGGVVSNCYNAGHIQTDYAMAGGIAGSSTSATIENCANTGTIDALYINSYQKDRYQTQAGGIVGYATYSKISNVVNSGTVTAFKKAGGIVGYDYASASSASTIKNAVNYGFVTSIDDATTGGNIIGDNYLSTVEGSYYYNNINKVGASNNGKLEGATGLSSTALATDTLSLDKSVWTLVSGSYPVLTFAKDETQVKLDTKAVLNLAEQNTASYISKEATLGNTSDVKWTLVEGKSFSISSDKLAATIPATGVANDTLVAEGFGTTRQIPISTMNVNVLTGEGTEAAPFLIYTADDMLTLSNFVENSGFDYDGFFFKVMANLDFTGKTYVPVAYGTNIFNATFDGNNKTISNIALTADASDKTITGRGLFGSVGANGTIKNIVLDNTNKFEAYQYAGGIVGLLYGTVENCTTSAAVSTVGSSYAAGIAGFGYPSCAIRNCKNTGDVTAKTTYAAGILAATSAGAFAEIDSCTNSGTILATTSYAGGIVGSASATVTNSVNTGFVQATTKNAGGIMAEALAYSAIKNSHNEGQVNANQYTGGIVGSSVVHSTKNRFVIDNCYNTGDILPSVTSNANVNSYAGGIAGALKGGFLMNNCYNTADIAPNLVKSAYIAGLVSDAVGTASAYSTISNSYNTGNITCDRYTGGLVGRFAGDSTAVIDHCYNLGNVTATNATSSYIGGMVGTGGYYLTDSYNAGDITGAANYVGGLSGYLTGKAYTYERNFNIGAVKTTATTTSKGCQVGGLIGMGRPDMVDCANYGSVSGVTKVGGILGCPGNASAASYIVKLRRSYNVGEVSAKSSYGNITGENSSCKYLVIDSCFFDTSVNEASTYDKTLSGVTGLSHSELVNAKLGGAFVNGVATYPQIAGYEQTEAHSFGVATILLRDGETTDSVANDFKVGTPYGAVWTASSNLAIDGNDVTLKNTEQVEEATLTLTVGKYTRTYKLTINRKPDGVSAPGSDSKEVASVKYYTTSGIEIAQPSAEMGVIIEKTVYTDGTTSTRKYVPNY